VNYSFKYTETCSILINIGTETHFMQVRKCKIYSKDIYNVTFLFQINAVRLNLLFNKESWRKKMYHGFHKNIKQHNCSQYWFKKKFLDHQVNILDFWFLYKLMQLWLKSYLTDPNIWIEVCVCVDELHVMKLTQFYFYLFYVKCSRKSFQLSFECC